MEGSPLKSHSSGKSSSARGLGKSASSRLNENDWSLCDDYVSSNHPAKFECQRCGDVVRSSVARMISKRPLLCKCRRSSNAKARQAAKLLGYIAEASRRGGELLSRPEKIDEHERLLWQCKSGHRWYSSPRSVIRAKSWCPKCARNAPRDIQELIEIANARGGELLSSEYKGVDASYQLRCSLGHSFKNQFKKLVDLGQWCPICNKSSKSEELARTTMEQIFEEEFPKIRPKWLRNSRGKQMELDGYSLKLQLAFEYQGIQHYEVNSAFKVDLQQRIEDDQRKRSLCEENGVKLFILDYKTEYRNFPREILKQAQKFGIADKYNFGKIIDFNKAYIREDRLEELRRVLSEKNIKLISEKWIDTDTRYEMECLTCGNHWKAPGSAFFNARRVAGCKRCAMKLLIDSQRGSLDELRIWASRFGGSLLSKEYLTNQSKYRFICSKGHVFEGKFNNMKNRGQFCPECEGRQQREQPSPSVVNRRLKEKSLTALEEFKSLDERLLCKCDICGEQVAVVMSHLKQGIKGCPYCSGHKTRESDALIILQELDYEPLSDFSGGADPWEVRCRVCLQKRRVVISSIKKSRKKCGHKGSEKYILKKGYKAK